MQQIREFGGRKGHFVVWFSFSMTVVAEKSSAKLPQT
jgi:hypothetical protein